MEFKLVFKSAEEINMILTALGELPARVSMGMIMDIQRQAQAQMPAEDGAVEAPVPPSAT